jgi:hypothetical protein
VLETKLLTQYPIYHITHIDNLPGIIGDGFLWCDRERMRKMPPHTNVGYKHIKERRLIHPVTVAKLGFLGDYVPFNFCSRSVMLYVLHKGHPGYSGGQNSIVHLVSSVINIQATGQAWFWTDRHADLAYARQFDSLEKIDSEIDWTVMRLEHWSNGEIKEKRQAEFLVHSLCPWSAIEMIAVENQAMADKVYKIIQVSVHQPKVRIQGDWYY